MQSAIQRGFLLNGFVEQALDSLTIRPPINVWRQPTPEITKVADKARVCLCVLAYNFDLHGKAAALAERLSTERSNPFAVLLLQLALRAWPINRRRGGYRADVEEGGKEAYQQLHDDLMTLFLGSSEDAAAVCDTIRTICKAVISGANEPRPTPQPASDPAFTQSGSGLSVSSTEGEEQQETDVEGKNSRQPDSGQEIEEQKAIGGLVFHPGGFRYGTADVKLKGKPLMVLRSFADAPDRIQTAADLYKLLYGDNVDGRQESTIRTHVCKARSALHNAVLKANVKFDGDPLPCIDKGRSLAWQLVELPKPPATQN
jgi:hypothetical protein